MPDGFEYVIRPYQAPGSLGNTVIPSTPRGSQERAHLVWGGVGTMPETKILNPSTKVNTCKEDLQELERESDVVRIEQPGKPENYVEVARARLLKLDKNENNKNPVSTSSLTFTEQNFLKYLDARLADQSSNFSSPARPGTPESSNKKCGVTWKLLNEE